jgi:hypothetical protein
MAIKEITIGFARTVNLGNYESARVEAAVKVELESDHPEYVYERMEGLQKELGDLLTKTWNAQINTIKGKAK